MKINTVVSLTGLTQKFIFAIPHIIYVRDESVAYCSFLLKSYNK